MIIFILSIDKSFFILGVFLIIFYKYRVYSLYILIGIFIAGYTYIINIVCDNDDFFKYNNKEIIVTGKITNIKKGNVYLDKKILLKDLDEDLKIGQNIKVSGICKMPTFPRNDGEFNQIKYYKYSNLKCSLINSKILYKSSTYSKLKNSIFSLNKKISIKLKNKYNQKYINLILSMIYGNNDELSSNDKERYKEVGISHILAISGAHISIVVSLIYIVISNIKINYRLAQILMIIIVYFYGELTMFSISTKRAVYMFVYMIVCILLEKNYDFLASVSIAGIIILFQYPFNLYNPSFILSFLATFSIYISNKVYVEGKFLELKKSIFISLFLMPILMYLFYEIKIYSFVITMLILPLFSYLVYNVLIASILVFFSKILADIILIVPLGVMVIYDFYIDLFLKLPFSNIITGKPSIIFIIIYYIIMFFIIKKNKKLIYILFLALFLIIPNKNVKISMLDIGQGDCIVIQNKKSTYLVDGGSSNIKNVYKYRLEPYLLSNGISKIDACFISHSHIDHINAIVDMIENKKIKINKIYLSKIVNKDKMYIELEKQAKRNNIFIEYVKYGDNINLGLLKFQIIHPTDNYNAKEINSYSMCFNLKYKNFNMLFTGDLLPDGEINVIKNTNLSNIDVLKVAHHGSKYSTTDAFIKKISPKVSIISCSEKNMYNHPSKDTINRIKKTGSKVYITKDKGEIDIITNGKNFKVKFKVN